VTDFTNKYGRIAASGDRAATPSEPSLFHVSGKAGIPCAVARMGDDVLFYRHPHLGIDPDSAFAELRNAIPWKAREISISLGAMREFRFRSKCGEPSVRVALTHGSVLVMRGETQEKWMHGIEKCREPCGERINLTFRLTCDSGSHSKSRDV
jgi:hypothetical protein